MLIFKNYVELSDPRKRLGRTWDIAGKAYPDATPKDITLNIFEDKELRKLTFKFPNRIAFEHLVKCRNECIPIDMELMKANCVQTHEESVPVKYLAE